HHHDGNDGEQHGNERPADFGQGGEKTRLWVRLVPQDLPDHLEQPFEKVADHFAGAGGAGLGAGGEAAALALASASAFALASSLVFSAFRRASTSAASVG